MGVKRLRILQPSYLHDLNKVKIILVLTDRLGGEYPAMLGKFPRPLQYLIYRKPRYHSTQIRLPQTAISIQNPGHFNTHYHGHYSDLTGHLPTSPVLFDLYKAAPT